MAPTPTSALPRAFWYLWAAALVNRLGGFVYPFLALYLTQAHGMPVARAGLIVAAYGAGSIVSGPVGGFLADRFGRRITMLAGFTLGAAAMLQLGYARAPWHIALSTLMLGFLSDLYRPAQQAAVADLVPPSERTRAFGYLYWAVNLGFAGAAALAGFLADFDFKLLFVGDAITTVLCGVIVYLRVPETHPARDLRVRPRPSLSTPFRDRTFMLFVLAQFLCALVFAQGNATLPIDMRAHGVPPKLYGSLIAINGVMIVLLQPAAIGFVARLRRGRALGAGALLTGIGFGLNAAGHSVPWYALSILVWTAGELVFSPVTPTVIADLAPPSLRGGYQGVFQMSWGLSSFLAPALGSLVLGRLGDRWLWGGCLAVCATSAALHLAIAPARRRRLERMAGPDGAAREDGVRLPATGG